jgi:thiamine-monophosphate kinase
VTREDRFVEKLRALLPEDERILVGPGDDAAVLRPEIGELVATTDMLVEGVDFLPGEDPRVLGRRALGVNLSDLAAMGARPEFFLLSVAFAPERGEDFPLEIARGSIEKGKPFAAALVGGDLSRAPQTVISIALWGRPEGKPLTRAGARTGDLLFVSGYPGRAAAGLRLRKRMAGSPPSDSAERDLLDAHRDPQPRVELGLALARLGLARAAIDLSDGLGVDAGRLARASGLRAIVEEERLPVSPALRQVCEREGRQPLEDVLSGGDDYELLFAAAEDASPAIAALATAAVPITRIGRLEPGEGAVLRGARGERDIASAGYDHFAGAEPRR